ncbi:MAG: SURF1 family protein, partial [Gammaproteobacteria bacterium]|nr:SURF1 family protein [Gammaproteobacteria bacterium]
MHIGNFIFKPRLIPTLATLVMVPFLASLGVWQLNRAHQRQALLNAFEQRTHEPPLPLDAALQHPHGTLYRQIVVTGRYDRAHQVLLDNQMHHDQPGYHVFTP